MARRHHDALFYTGRALSDGVLRVSVVSTTDDGAVTLQLPDGDLVTERRDSKYLFPNRMDAARAAYYDVVQAESGVRGVVEAYARKADGYRAIMDELFAELYPQATISASARIR